MTYAGFLALFLVTPTVLLLLLQLRRLTRSNWVHLLLLMGVALIYTTPWDNYLVASRVWWYDPGKVTGLLIGFVPIEEYTFFLLQPLMTGLLFLFLKRNDSGSFYWEGKPKPDRRRIFASLVAIPWLASLYGLIFGPLSARYLSLELAWALPPFILQLAFGADLLRANWRPAVLTLLISTSYLIAADAWAISQGIWTISEAMTLGLNPAPAVVLEEMAFFLLTNLLVVGGLTLLEDRRSRLRLEALLDRFWPGRRSSV